MKTKESIKEIFKYEGRNVEIEWIECTNFSKLKNVTQAYGVLFNEVGEILIVSSSNGKKWGIPGGTPESKDKSFEETLIREVDEEADVEINEITPIGYQNSVFIGKLKSSHQQLRYTAKITKIKKQTKDPALNLIFLRKFIKPEEFLDYCPWGKTGKAMIEKAVEIWKKN